MSELNHNEFISDKKGLPGTELPNAIAILLLEYRYFLVINDDGEVERDGFIEELISAHEFVCGFSTPGILCRSYSADEMRNWRFFKTAEAMTEWGEEYEQELYQELSKRS